MGSAGERGSKAVDSLDSLLADMETFRSNNASDMDRDKSKKIQIEIGTKKKENLEKKLENLTDKLLESFKPDSDVTATARTEDDLGTCHSCHLSITDSAVLAGGHTFHQDCFTCTHCHKRLGDQFFGVADKNYCPLHQTVALDSCTRCDAALEGVPFLVSAGSVNCKPCYTKYKAAKCVRCSQGIVGSNSGQRKTSLVTCQGKTYHQECYTCGDCGKELTGEFVCPAGDEIVCFSCDTKRKK